MRVFVTGATGFIGSAVVRELIVAGHQVTGLARSDEAAAALSAAGVGVHRGSLDDLDSLGVAAAAADGVIHTGYNHDFSDIPGAAQTDRLAITALGDALASSDRPFVVAAGIPMLPGRSVITEEDAAPASGPHPRVSEPVAMPFAERGVRVSIIRMPPSVHGEGDHGFVPILIGIARDKGLSAYVGEGANRWPAVHRLDAAALFRIALERAPAGTRLNAVGDEGVPFRDIAGVIGRQLDLPVTSIPREDADGHFGWFALFASLDERASSAGTERRFGWRPTRPGLIADLEEGHYFRAYARTALGGTEPSGLPQPSDDRGERPPIRPVHGDV
jgi:nucleoside-diphosphate-sugar epimerase